MAGVDVNRTTSGISLPTELSQEVWQKVQDASVVMGLARKVALSGRGTTYHEILTDGTAAFVDETGRKLVSNATFQAKVLAPHKIAYTATFSDEFRRDLPGLFNAVVSRMPGALAKTFDAAALHGTNAPASNFDDLGSVTGVSIANTTPGSVDAYAGFLAALGTVPNLSAWALSPAGEILALGNRDTNGAPIIAQNVQSEGSVGSILARPVFRSQNAYLDDNPDVVGIAGDWSKAVWGQVSGVDISISDNPVYAANGTLISAGWQDNMIAVRAEIHVGFRADTSQFVRLLGADESSSS